MSAKVAKLQANNGGFAVVDVAVFAQNLSVGSGKGVLHQTVAGFETDSRCEGYGIGYAGNLQRNVGAVEQASVNPVS